MSLRAVALVVAALVTAGCSSSEESTVTSTQSRRTVAPAVVPLTIAATTSSVAVDEWTDVDSLAGALSAIEAEIRDPGASAEELTDVGQRQQLAYRMANRHPEWRADLFQLVDPVALGPFTHHLVARQAQVDHAAGRPSVRPSYPVPQRPPGGPAPRQMKRH